MVAALATLVGCGSAGRRAAPAPTTPAVTTMTARGTQTPLTTTPAHRPAAPIALGNVAAALRAGSDGSVRVAVAGGAVTERVVDASGRVAAPRRLLAPATHLGFADAAYTPDGGLVATERQVLRRMTLRAVDRRPDGTVTAPKTISDPTIRIGQDTLTVGPTGAVAAMFDEQPGNSTYLPRLTFRPAGAARFQPTIKLKPDSDHSSTDFHVILGPDGGGALLGTNGTQRPSFIQRLSPGGVLGPAIPIPTTLSGSTTGATAFAPDGTLAVALNVQGTNTSALFATTLAPHATAVGTVTKLAPRGLPVVDQDNVGITIDGVRHITVMAELDDDRLEILDSNAGADWRLTALLPATMPFDGELLLHPGGGVSAVWVDTTSEPTGTADARNALAGAYRPPGGQFDRPHALTPATTQGLNIGVSEGLIPGIALPGDRVAIPYMRSSVYTGATRDFIAVAAP